MRHVIVGNGVAGVTAAAAISDSDRTAEITILAAEPVHYYRRPWLPDLIGGTYSRPEELYPHPAEWYAERRIWVRLNERVDAVDTTAHTVTTAAGVSLPYDKLLLATGANSFMPPIQNAQRPEVMTLRSMADALAIQEQARQSKRAVVIGGGLLGLESARALKAAGLEVTVLEVFGRLLPRQLDAEGAVLLQGLIEGLGIAVRTSVETASFEGESVLTGVRLKSGELLHCDMAIVSAGVRSDLELARKLGLQINKGALANEFMQSSIADIYLAGDVAEAGGRVYGIIPPAIEQARVAAANMVGGNTTAYPGSIPTNTLKVVGIDLTSLGIAVPDREGYVQVRHSDPLAGVYRKLVLENGRLVGAILIGDRKATLAVTRLVNQGATMGEDEAKRLVQGTA